MSERRESQFEQLVKRIKEDIAAETGRDAKPEEVRAAIARLWVSSGGPKRVMTKIRAANDSE